MKQAEQIGSEMIQCLEGANPDQAMAALTAVMGTVMAACGIPTGEAMDAAMVIVDRQVREHHTAAVASVMDEIERMEQANG